MNAVKWVARVLLTLVGLFLIFVGFGRLDSNPAAGSFTLLLGVVVLIVGLAFVLDSGMLRDFVERRAHALWRLTSGQATNSSGGGSATSQPMGTHVLRFLVVYLVTFFLLTIGGMWTVWTAQPGTEPLALPDTVTNVSPADPVRPPMIDSVAPDTVTFGVGQSALFVFGSGFSDASVVRVDGEIHRGGRLINASLMVVELHDTDFGESRTRYVTVTTDTQPPSRAVSFTVRSGADITVDLTIPFLPGPFPITVEARLLLLAILMGIGGGTLGSLNSLASFRGDGKLTGSWFLFFFVGPFLGGGVSFFLYVVVRAGLLTGTSVEFESGATPWGILAISGLAGLFYDKTLLKLREVFVALYSPRDSRGGKIDHPAPDQLAITTESLPSATRGRRYRSRLVAVGGERELSWSVEPPLPPGLALDPLTGTIEGTPAADAPITSHTFTAMDMRRRTAGTTMDFEVRS